MTHDELYDVLAKHLLWLQGKAGGARADLSYANLSSADLRYADLRYANLSSADLRYANLSYANLSSANLSSADLSYADLSATIYGKWRINAYRDLLWLGPLGSRNDFLAVNLADARVMAGCFEGSIDDFRKAVTEKHSDNKYGREYLATCDYIESLIKARKGT